MSYVHVSRPSRNGTTLAIFHGTGGDEHDLLPLAEAIDPEAGQLSLRGNVSEGGALRFFRRFAEGVFDQEDLARRTQEAGEFLASVRPQGDRIVALGFSNGANFAASLLLRRPESFDAAILIRAMTPFVPEDAPNLSGKRVLLLTGEFDPILPIEDARRLAGILRSAGAEVEHVVLPAGHGLTEADVEHARAFALRLAVG